MNGIEHLTPKKVEKVTCRLWKVSSSLNGLGSLFRFQSRESCIDQDEYAGIGHLLQELSEEINRLEDILRCGYDSIAKAEIERDYEDKLYSKPKIMPPV